MSAPSALTINVQPYQTPFTVYEVGQAMSHVVATGTDNLGPGDPITATIDWGDKRTPTSQQVVSSANGAYQVSAMHTYSQAGSWTITVSLSSSLVGPLVGAGTATVVAPAFTLSAATYPDLFAAIGVHSGIEYRAVTNIISGLKVMRHGGLDPFLKRAESSRNHLRMWLSGAA